MDPKTREVYGAIDWFFSFLLYYSNQSANFFFMNRIHLVIHENGQHSSPREIPKNIASFGKIKKTC